MCSSDLVLALAALSAAFAVDTRFWTFATKEDHDKATMKRLSLRSDGLISLAPAVKELQDAGVSYLWAAARGADGTIYTGGGNPGATAAKLFAVKGGQAKLLAELAGFYKSHHGLTDEEIHRLTLPADAPGWDDFDRTLVQATDELHDDAFIAEPTWQALNARYSTEQLIDLVFTVGQYTLVSMALNTFGVQLDEGVPGFPDGAGEAR